jgi:glycosyltransferase involved in cell wall biosynthesis
VNSLLPSVALVRGIGLDANEMVTFEPLLDRYRLRAFGLHRNRTDMGSTRIPYEWLQWKDSIHGRSAMNAYRARWKSERYYMPGLEKKLAGSALVHTTETVATCSWQVAREKKKLGYKVVVTCVENIPHVGWDQPTIRSRAEEVIEATDAFIALTPSAKRVLMHSGVAESEITVIPYGVDVERFQPAPPHPDWLRDLEIQPADFVILFIGRLVWEKGVYDLMNAVQWMDRRNLKLIVVGGGPERESLEEYARFLKIDPVVRFASIPFERVHEIHSLSSVLVLPSLPTRGVREQFGLVLIESMASGKPVIVTRCGSMMEVIGDAGLSADPGDPHSLAAAIEQLRNNRDLARDLGRRGRTLAETVYDRNKVADQIHRVFQRTLG